nr:unnamed protein product [Digitaria exilis]
MLLATFATSLTYEAGLSLPGGFWDNTGDAHRAGEAVLQERRPGRLVALFVCNTAALVASLLIIVLLLDRKLRARTARSCGLYGCIVVALAGLVGAYAAGSCRSTHATVFVVALVVTVLGFIFLLLRVFRNAMEAATGQLSQIVGRCCSSVQGNEASSGNNGRHGQDEQLNQGLDKARSLVLLLATLAATITYQAALDPPGGAWQEDADGHRAGDPILLAKDPTRYKAFFYCNSTAFVASLAAIVLVQSDAVLKRNALEAAMILDLFGLMGAYAAGSCRDAITSVAVAAIAGAVLIYVVIHVVFCTMDHKAGTARDADANADASMENRRKRLLLFAIFAATITQQSTSSSNNGVGRSDQGESPQGVGNENGPKPPHTKRKKYLVMLGILAASVTYSGGLNRPGGGWQSDGDRQQWHEAGDPVLHDNRRGWYNAFFYCNSASFVASVVVIVLLLLEEPDNPESSLTKAINMTIMLDLLGLLVAYGAGSGRDWAAIGSVVAIATAVLGSYIAVYAALSSLRRQGRHNEDNHEAAHQVVPLGTAALPYEPLRSVGGVDVRGGSSDCSVASPSNTDAAMPPPGATERDVGCGDGNRLSPRNGGKRWEEFFVRLSHLIF